jgi:hypothetical protein
MKTTIRLLTVLIALALTPAAARAQKVNADWDRAVSFGTFGTYAWTQGTVPAGANPLMVQRAQSAVESELSAIGLVKADQDPDVLVAMHAATKEDVSLQAWRYGPGWRYGGTGQVDVNRVLVGTLVIDLIDARTKKLVWRGTATDTVSDNPQKNEKKIHKSVEKMFKKYPTAAR